MMGHLNLALNQFQDEDLDKDTISNAHLHLRLKRTLFLMSQIDQVVDI